MYRSLLILFFSISVNAAEIDGMWIQDTNRSIEFNDNHTIQNELEKVIYACSNETLVLNNGNGSIKTDDYQCAYNNKKTIIKGHKFDFKYTIIGSTDDSIIIQAITSDNNISYSTFYFQTPDIMWSYTGGTAQLNDSHKRQYYHRAK